MIEFTGRLEVGDPPLTVYERLADMAQIERWNPNVRSSKRVSGERLEAGSRYVSTIRRGPVQMTAKSELVNVETGRLVHYESSIAGFRSIDSLTFEPLGAGTRVTFRNESRAPVWLRPLVALLNRVFQRQATRAVEGARQYLTQRARD